MSELSPKIGQTVRTKDGRQGVVRYKGKIQVAVGDWLGLELPDASGKNDGSAKGERYFSCPPGHGIFVRKESVILVVPEPRQTGGPLTPNPNNATHDTKAPAAAQRDRPSSGAGLTADVARKRQSLMSAASARPPSTRLSVRVSKF